MTDDTRMQIPVAALAALANGDIENAIVAATPGGILAQEAAGQRAVIAAQMLPKQLNHYSRLKMDDVVSAWGFTILGEADDLFMNVQLALGWSIKPTEHSLWSEVIDDRGHVRGGVFYKAAFYDRNAHLDIYRRFYVSSEYEDVPTRRQRNVVIDRRTGVTRIGEWFANEAYDQALFDACQREQEVFSADLATQYPDHRNPFAYWDQE